MRVVDLFVDLYEWEDNERERVHRMVRAGKHVYTAARHGASAVSPLVVVDAALAVLDALDAYVGYRRAKEVTQQLKIEGDSLCRLLQELYEQQAIHAKVMEDRHAQMVRSLRARLSVTAAEIEISRDAFDSLSLQAKNLGGAIGALRVNSAPNCACLLKLERAYYDLVDLLLLAMMNAVKE
ncbi:hypothetical protein [Azospira sp.]|uniref:hypothetical protein n=1 Tax=Azospira sp. TaxID=1872671 RepID=UPI00255F982E|nr:hypothetical protein [Azospira sp.]MDK9691449.1 hypothetical protein [Azospira sp.]